MKYSYNWLREISGTKKTADELASILTMHSFELDGMEKIGGNFDGVVVGKILEIKKHPNADKLQLVKVEIGKTSPQPSPCLPCLPAGRPDKQAYKGEGDKEAGIISVVCGAQNISVGDKVPVAPVGITLPGGITMKEVEIRGVKSCGMLCAEDELGIGKDHSGIVILDKNIKVGTKLNEILEGEDMIIDLDVLSNRGHDALSHVGMAREISVLENRKLDYDFDGLKLPNKKTNQIKVKIEDKKLCPRYIGALMTNIKVQESPTWIKRRLLALGMKPINNIVDTTNYVMLELGQPLHAFDVSKIKDAQIVVRTAKNGEKIKLLDETVKDLNVNDLVIADSNRVLAIAGIMGGEDSGINDNTASIVIESANFSAASIRKTRMKLGLKTEASDRFEKEIDPNLAEKAMVRVIEIIEHIAGGKLEGIVDVYPQKIKNWQIKLDLAYVEKLLGEVVPQNKIAGILIALGMKIKNKDKMLTVEIPTFRIDLKTQEDLIEEVGRIYGYEKIKSTTPIISMQPAKIDDLKRFTRNVKNVLTGLNFSEVYNYSFYSQKDANNCKLTDRHLELENPMNPDQSLMRVSLAPGILNNIKKNINNFKEFNIFEIGKVFDVGTESLPDERKMLVGIVVLEKDKKADTFYALKGMVDCFLSKIEAREYFYEDFSDEKKSSFWHKSRTAEIKLKEKSTFLGRIGEIDSAVLSSFDIHKRVAMFEFDLEEIKNALKEKKEFKMIGKYPVVTRDISLLSDSSVTAGEIIKTIKEVGGGLVLNVELFDVFEKEKKNSLAFHVEFGSDKRTLESKEADSLMEKITLVLEKNLGIEVRK